MMRMRWVVPALAAGLLAGCGTFPVPGYSPDYPSLDRLKTQSLSPVDVTAFEPRDASAPVNQLTLRGAPFAPAGGSFASYIEAALRSDLTELRRLDPRSDTRIAGELLLNRFDISGFSTGEGELRLRLRVTRAGQLTLDKTYQANITFPIHLAANVAVPRAQAEYPRLVQRLLQNIYTDPAFQAALKP